MEFGGGLSPPEGRRGRAVLQRRDLSRSERRETPETTLTERGAEPLEVKTTHYRAQLGKKAGRGDTSASGVEDRSAGRLSRSRVLESCLKQTVHPARDSQARRYRPSVEQEARDLGDGLKPAGIGGSCPGKNLS